MRSPRNKDTALHYDLKGRLTEEGKERSELKENESLVCSLKAARLVQKIDIETPESHDSYRYCHQDCESHPCRVGIVVFALIRIWPSIAISDIDVASKVSQACYS